MTERGGALRIAMALIGAFVFRYGCFIVMVAATLWNERRSAPRLYDRVLEIVPYVESIDEWNYWTWLLCYLPPSLALLWIAPRRCVRFLVAGGLLSLLRGFCVCLTGLGPVRENEVGLNEGLAADAWLHDLPLIVNPLKVFFEGTAHTHLTQDMFFSGHVSTTFLLLLYAWPYRRLRWVCMVGHGLVVASVFLSHLHYTIDVVGAWAITWVLFTWREGAPSVGLTSDRDPPGWGPRTPATTTPPPA